MLIGVAFIGIILLLWLSWEVRRYRRIQRNLKKQALTPKRSSRGCTWDGEDFDDMFRNKEN